jgi:RNA ligase
LKSYPEIQHGIRRGVRIYAFDKLDGSNVRVEWTRKRGFTKFGKRNGLIDDSNEFLPEAPKLIQEKYEDDLCRIFKAQRWEQATAYFEFFGENSFAGNHEHELHDVVLFDVTVFKKGFLEPNRFLRLFGDLDIPALLYQGNFTSDIERQVREGTLPGMTFEGVVCKGSWDKKKGRPLMFKYKSEKWINQLRAYCGGNEALFRKML